MQRTTASVDPAISCARFIPARRMHLQPDPNHTEASRRGPTRHFPLPQRAVASATSARSRPPPPIILHGGWNQELCRGQRGAGRLARLGWVFRPHLIRPHLSFGPICTQRKAVRSRALRQLAGSRRKLAGSRSVKEYALPAPRIGLAAPRGFDGRAVLMRGFDGARASVVLRIRRIARGARSASGGT